MAPTLGNTSTMRLVSKDTGRKRDREEITADNKRINNCKKLRNNSGDVDSQGAELAATDVDEQASSSEDSESEDETMKKIIPQAMSDKKYAVSSGLKDTLHGNIYQLKLLMFFLNRGLKEGHDFSLATEMSVAEKFDDVVFEYGNEPKKRCLYLQAKHKLDESKTISVGDLLNERDGDYSLQKYFISYRRMKKNTELIKYSEIEQCIIWTNIDFTSGDNVHKSSGIRLRKLETSEVLDKDSERDVIGLRKVETVDQFGHRQISGKQPERYKLVVNERCMLHEILQNSSDANVLAKTLANCVIEKKPLSLHSEIFKIYHVILKKEVIDTENESLSESFISARDSKFQKLYYLNYLKLLKKKNILEDHQPLDKHSLTKIPESFGKPFVPVKNPKLTKEFSKAFVKLIRNAKNSNLIEVDRKVCDKTADKGSDEKFIGDDIDKLAGNVLIVEDRKIKFYSEFLNGTILPQLGNIRKFRESLKTELEDEYHNLSQYQFEIKNSDHWAALYSTAVTELPDDVVETSEISEFFDKLVFAVNQLNEIELGDLIVDEITADRKFTRAKAKFASDSLQRKMLDWFKKKREESVYLTAENGRAMFESIERKFHTIRLLNRSSHYLEELEGYGIRFKDENPALKSFLESNSGQNVNNRAFNLIAAEETWLTVIRARQAIQKIQKYKKKDSWIFIRLWECLPSMIDDLVIRAFESPLNPDLFVIEYGLANKRYLQRLCKKLCKAMKNIEHYNIQHKNMAKKLILITKFAGIESSVHFEHFEENHDEFGFNNLTEMSRQKLLKKRNINFQGETGVSFGQLLKSRKQNATDFGNLINSSTLCKLIRGEEIRVGDSLTKSDFEMSCTFREVFLQRSILDCQLDSEVYAISGIGNEDLVRLGVDQRKIQCSAELNQQGVHLCKFIILTSEHEPEQFQMLREKCSETHNCHWLKRQSEEWIWKESHGNITNVLKYGDVDNYCNFDKTTYSCLTADQLALHDEAHKVVIISTTDATAVGETSVLTYLAEKMKSTNSRMWVIRINLEDSTTQLKIRSSSTDDFNNAVDFLVVLSSLEANLDKECLKTAMKNQHKVALLFDGYSRISADLRKTVIRLLKTLTKSGKLKLFIASTPDMAKILENDLGAFSHTMEPILNTTSNGYPS